MNKSGFDDLMSEMFENISNEKDSAAYKALYIAYLRGYGDATTDSLEQLNRKIEKSFGVPDDIKR
jgi:hypothetical protein